jgi:hypothetical protein
MGGDTGAMSGPILLSFANTHATMAAADCLADLGIPHRVIPRPVTLAGGCGIAIEVPEAAAGAALKALLEAGRGPVAAYDAEEGQRWVRR